MKKFIMLFFVVLCSQLAMAMEPTHNKALSQEEKDLLGLELLNRIIDESMNGTGGISRIKELIVQGADVNYRSAGYGTFPLMHIALSSFLTPYQKLILAQELIKNGADVNLLDESKQTALMLIKRHSGEDFAKCLIQAGTNIYHDSGQYISTHLCCLAIRGFKESSELILQMASQLTDFEKASIKTWFLVEHRLKCQGRGLHKDIKMVITNLLVDAYAQDVHKRIIRAGAPRALELFKDLFVPTINKTILEKYLELDFLKKRVLEQINK